MYKHNIESQPQSFVFQVRASQGIGKIPSLWGQQAYPLILKRQYT